MGGRHHFQRGPQTVECKLQPVARDLGEQLAPHTVAALAANIHLHIVHRPIQNEIQITLFAGLVLAAGQRNQVFFLEAQIRRVVLRRQRLFQPGDVEGYHLSRQLLDTFQVVIAVAHAPPGVPVHHEVEIGTDRLTHEAHRLQILLDALRRAHLVCPEPQFGNSGRLGRGGLRWQIEAGASVQPDAVADAPAEEFGNRRPVGLARQIIQRDLHCAVSLHQVQTGPVIFQKLHTQRVRVG